MTPNEGKAPRVSIGMPVFNGGELMRNALNSLLMQDFTDFELNIADNASTDNTEEICREYAARDSRINYVRRDKNYGMNNNGRLVFSMSRSPYHMWAAHDDQWDPSFIRRCVECLDSNPELVMASPGVQFLDMNLQPINWPYPPLHTVGMGLRDRVAAVFHETGIGYNAYGIYRKEYLHKIDLDLNCYGGDVVMLMQLMFLGEVEHIPEKLFKFRLNPRTAEQQIREMSEELSNKNPRKHYTNLTINLLRSINKAEISGAMKRVLISDAIEIIALKSKDWRNVLLMENPEIIEFIEPARCGLHPSAEANLVAIFSSLLLPYCYQGASYDGAIDFSGVGGFNAISVKDKKTPSPGHKEFVESITQLVEKQMYSQALLYYDAYRPYQANSVITRQIDPLIERIRPLKKDLVRQL
jgi:glycosyltransferase involved in cell wall biosynthesis